MAHSHSRRTRSIVLLIGGAVAALSLTPAAEARKPRAERFAGTCDMSGAIRHDPGLCQTPRFNRIHGVFDGTCSGTLRDRRGRTRRLNGAPAGYDGRGAGELSCLGGTAPGTGKLTFGRGRTIRFSLTERRTPGVATVTLKGAAGGTGTVVGTVSRDEDLVELNQRCMGPGIQLLRGDLRLVSPGIAG